MITNPSYLDVYGLLFGSGSTQVNIYGNGGGDYAFLYTTPNGSFGAPTGGTFIVTSVSPEPSSLILVGLAVLGMVGYARRRNLV